MPSRLPVPDKHGLAAHAQPSGKGSKRRTALEERNDSQAPVSITSETKRVVVHTPTIQRKMRMAI